MSSLERQRNDRRAKADYHGGAARLKLPRPAGAKNNANARLTLPGFTDQRVTGRGPAKWVAR
jgi:hypothetical protein